MTLKHHLKAWGLIGTLVAAWFILNTVDRNTLEQVAVTAIWGAVGLALSLLVITAAYIITED
jgi:hypothetical protein